MYKRQILALFIGLGILFDIIGVAVTAADEKPFHSMAAHREKLSLIHISWVYMVYYMLPCVLFYNIEADTLWAMTDLLSAIYVIITLLFIYSKQKEIFRLFHDFWDRFVPAQERGEHLSLIHI